VNIPETVRDTTILTKELEVICLLSNGFIFDDLEWPPTPFSRSRYIQKANISRSRYT